LTIDAADVSDRVAGFRIGLVMIAAIILVAMAGVGWIVARSVTRPIRHLQHAAGRFAAGDLTPGDPARGAPGELVELERTMNSMAGRLDELLSTQRAFVADASHQLRTPLTALRLRLENVAAACTAPGAATPETTATDSGDLRDEIDDALAETERLGSLVDDLLALARAERPAAAEPTPVARLTADRVDTWSAVADERAVSIELTAPDPGVEALAVPGAVEQILDNLLDNALRFSPERSTITVDVRALPSGRVELRVGDQGPGLDAEQRRQATDRFWRGEQPVGTAAETSGGSGLGLAIVQALAIASGGDVRLEAGTDGPAADGCRGLAVIIELPRVDQTESAPEAPPANAAASQRGDR
jgi:signal transduction histidine kinase